jgi:hypothetical protein
MGFNPQFFQPFILPLQGLNLSPTGFSQDISLEPVFARYHEACPELAEGFLQPFVVDVADNAFPSTEGSYGDFSTDILNDDPYFFLCEHSGDRCVCAISTSGAKDSLTLLIAEQSCDTPSPYPGELH